MMVHMAWFFRPCCDMHKIVVVQVVGLFGSSSVVIVADRDDSFGLVFSSLNFLHAIVVVQFVGSSGLSSVLIVADHDDSYGLVFSSLL